MTGLTKGLGLILSAIALFWNVCIARGNAAAVPEFLELVALWRAEVLGVAALIPSRREELKDIPLSVSRVLALVFTVRDPCQESRIALRGLLAKYDPALGRR